MKRFAIGAMSALVVGTPIVGACKYLPADCGALETVAAVESAEGLPPMPNICLQNYVTKVSTLTIKSLTVDKTLANGHASARGGLMLTGQNPVRLYEGEVVDVVLEAGGVVRDASKRVNPVSGSANPFEDAYVNPICYAARVISAGNTTNEVASIGIIPFTSNDGVSWVDSTAQAAALGYSTQARLGCAQGTIGSLPGTQIPVTSCPRPKDISNSLSRAYSGAAIYFQSGVCGTEPWLGAGFPFTQGATTPAQTFTCSQEPYCAPCTPGSCLADGCGRACLCVGRNQICSGGACVTTPTCVPNQGQYCDIPPGRGACASAGLVDCAGHCQQRIAEAVLPDNNFHQSPAWNGSWDWNCDGVVEPSEDNCESWANVIPAPGNVLNCPAPGQLGYNFAGYTYTQQHFCVTAPPDLGGHVPGDICQTFSTQAACDLNSVAPNVGSFRILDCYAHDAPETWIKNFGCGATFRFQECWWSARKKACQVGAGNPGQVLCK